MRKAPLDDVHARRALQYATDRQTLVEVVLFGSVSRRPRSCRRAPLLERHAARVSLRSAKAQEELAQSPTPDGFPLELKILAGSADDETLATALKDMWSQIGVEVTITPVKGASSTRTTTTRNFQAMSNYWTNDIVDPDELVAYAVLPKAPRPSSTGWANPEAQDLARQGAAELDPAKRKEIYFRIQEIYNEESPMLPLYYKPYVNVTTTRSTTSIIRRPGNTNWKTTWIEQ